MEQIEHVVVLMLENRSLDNLLGWLYADNNNVPNKVIPDSGDLIYDGLKENVFSNPMTWSGHTGDFPVVKGAESPSVPSQDPYEDYSHVTFQLFQTEKEPPEWTKPNMKGFLQDYDAWWEGWDTALQIMQTYSVEQAPILNGLARFYAVSDRWFSSVPSQTNPNRAFFTCGTSLGREANQNMRAKETFETNTLFNVLSENGVDWNIFFNDDNWPYPEGTSSYTRYTFPSIDKLPEANESIKSIKDFFSMDPADLPAFTFLEPSWGFAIPHMKTFQGTDYHPPTSIENGERFVLSIYEHLTSNIKAFEKTLFVITFDEHGGTYDHVGPPWGAISPDGKVGKTGFKFNRYGVRVPTILISPWIDEGVVFRSDPNDPESGTEYDHTSLTATILKWKGIDPATANLGNRVAVAPTFENVLDRSTSRGDIFGGQIGGYNHLPTIVSAPAPTWRRDGGVDVLFKVRGGMLYSASYLGKKATEPKLFRCFSTNIASSPRILPPSSSGNSAVFWRDDTSSIQVVSFGIGEPVSVYSGNTVTEGDSLSPPAPLLSKFGSDTSLLYQVFWVNNAYQLMVSSSSEPSGTYTHLMINPGPVRYTPSPVKVVKPATGYTEFIQVYWVGEEGYPWVSILQKDSSDWVTKNISLIPVSTPATVTYDNVSNTGNPRVILAYWADSEGRIYETSSEAGSDSFEHKKIGTGNIQSQLSAIYFSNTTIGQNQVFVFWRGIGPAGEKNELQYLLASLNDSGRTGDFSSGSALLGLVKSTPIPMEGQFKLRIYYGSDTGHLSYAEYDGKKHFFSHEAPIPPLIFPLKNLNVYPDEIYTDLQQLIPYITNGEGIYNATSGILTLTNGKVRTPIKLGKRYIINGKNQDGSGAKILDNLIFTAEKGGPKAVFNKIPD